MPVWVTIQGVSNLRKYFGDGVVTYLVNDAFTRLSSIFLKDSRDFLLRLSLQAIAQMFSSNVQSLGTI